MTRDIMYYSIKPTLLGTLTCTGDLITLCRNLENHSILPMLLGSYMITLGRNLMNHSILANAVRQTYLYK
jgi:hypothetical protein